MFSLKKVKTLVVLLAGCTLLTACPENNSGGGSVVIIDDSPDYGYYSSPGVTANRFVDALTSYDGTYYDSYVQLYAFETHRSSLPGEDDWFVIWDEKYEEYKAVSLQYIRAIEYYDYMRSDYSLAGEFRAIEKDDFSYGDLNGDYWGDDYEVVDYEYDGYFYGRNSGHAYEDEGETTDVNLIAAKKEQNEFYKKAAAVSLEFNLKINTAMSLVTLGKKIQGMQSKGELSVSDMTALSKDVEKLTGVGVAEVLAARSDDAKAEVLDKASKNLGTSAANIEQKLLPELFGINL